MLYSLLFSGHWKQTSLLNNVWLNECLQWFSLTSKQFVSKSSYYCSVPRALRQDVFWRKKFTLTIRRFSNTRTDQNWARWFLALAICSKQYAESKANDLDCIAFLRGNHEIGLFVVVQPKVRGGKARLWSQCQRDCFGFCSCTVKSACWLRFLENIYSICYYKHLGNYIFYVLMFWTQSRTNQSMFWELRILDAPLKITWYSK